MGAVYVIHRTDYIEDEYGNIDYQEFQNLGIYTSKDKVLDLVKELQEEADKEISPFGWHVQIGYDEHIVEEK